MFIFEKFLFYYHSVICHKDKIANLKLGVKVHLLSNWSIKINNRLFYTQVVHANIINLINIITRSGLPCHEIVLLWETLMRQQHHTAPDTAIHDREILTQDKQLMQSGNLINSFVTFYELHKHDMLLNQWLMQKFRLYLTLLQDEIKIGATAREIILTVESNNVAKISLYSYLDKGKSRENWLEQRIEDDASMEHITNVG